MQKSSHSKCKMRDNRWKKPSAGRERKGTMKQLRTVDEAAVREHQLLNYCGSSNYNSSWESELLVERSAQNPPSGTSTWFCGKGKCSREKSKFSVLLLGPGKANQVRLCSVLLSTYSEQYSMYVYCPWAVNIRISSRIKCVISV